MTGYLLVLIYSGVMVVAEPRTDLALCVEEARSRIGEQMKVKMWDSMAGSNPVPKIVLAFCAQGAVAP